MLQNYLTHCRFNTQKHLMYKKKTLIILGYL